MSNPQKRKGDRAELEAAALWSEMLGLDVRRALGAGRADDTGDLYGIPNTVVQVKSYKDIAAAVREARDGADRQAVNAGAPFRFGMVRHRGGEWTCVLSVEAMAVLLREVLA